MARTHFRWTAPRSMIAAVGTLAGHYWTLAPWLQGALRPAPVPPWRPWSTLVDDPRLGPLRLTGKLHGPANGRVVVLVHGLGGDADSYYVRLAAAAAGRQGIASLRLNLRGADLLGEDFYHAGITADLRAAIASEALAGFTHVHLLGFSLGGHVVLRYASEARDSRVRSVAAVCPPLDLSPTAAFIDRPARAPYRHYMLRRLKALYAEVAARRPVPLPVAEARRIRTIRAWDERIVAPRHGFAGAEDYWRKMSVAPRLPAIDLPALVVAAEHDPMVAAWAVHPPLDNAPNVTRVWLDRGGHVAFPGDVDFGLGQTGTAEDQLIGWLSTAP